MGKIDDGNRQVILDSLRNITLTDYQIIDLLLMIIDDWEIRAEVRKNLQRRNEPTQQQTKNEQVNIQVNGNKKPT